MFNESGSPYNSHSDDLIHFTNRVSEREAFERLVTLPEGEPLPVLVFHGVGGAGKSWLRRKLQLELEGISQVPSAVIDFDPLQDGGKYIQDRSAALLQIRYELGVECPRFDLAYAMMLHKQGGGDPAAALSQTARGRKEWVKEGANAAVSSVPFMSVLVLGAEKMVEWLARKERASAPEYQYLKNRSREDIYSELLPRLCQDLDEQLPPTNMYDSVYGCRAVVFFDTFEAIATETAGSGQTIFREEWIKEFCRRSRGVLVVISGQNRLHWPEQESYWKDAKHLEQHLVEGLSEEDARYYLEQAGITDAVLQGAVLHAASNAPKPGFHAWTLGLAADTLLEEKAANSQWTCAEDFALEPGDKLKLVERFLKALDKGHRQGMETLAATLRFDRHAALEAFGAKPRDFVLWEQIRRYSFVDPSREEGWFTLHAQMRRYLLELCDDREWQQEVNGYWVEYWTRRSGADGDGFAQLAWYHSYLLDPNAARTDWNRRAERSRAELDMGGHFQLLNWLSPLRERPAQVPPPSWARIMNDFGVELWRASLGDRAANLHAAIGCFDAALTVRTHQASPKDWAATQNNKGIALRDLPDRDRAANLRAAIACYDAALSVTTREALPQGWARTQNNKGNALGNLPDGDRAANLHAAIACYDAALTVRTREAFPQEWAMTQNNKGNALGNLPDGDRAANLRAAIDCFDTALTVTTREAFPQEWAMAQNNKGLALGDLPDGDRAANLRAAIECYDAALAVLTREAFPQDWAMTQNNKGIALGHLPESDRAANLRAAIECYDAALSVYTREAFPQDWAMTQNNKGTALADLPDGDRAANLHAAIDCYDAALTVRIREAFPQDWAVTCFNRSDALEELSDLAEALVWARRAVEGFEIRGHHHYLEMARRRVAGLEERLGK